VSDVDPKILEVFREEAGERLDRMVEALLGLEAERVGMEAVQLLFRETHSIKGSAGIVGLHEAGTIAHAIEDVLAGVREREMFPTSLIDPLLRATDAMRRVIAGETGVAGPAVAELSARASAPASGGEAQAKTPTGGSGASQPAERSIRTSARKIDRLLGAAGETVLHHRRLEHLLGDGPSQTGNVERIEEELSRGEVLVEDLQDSVIQMRTLPLSSITGPMPRAVRDLAAEHGIKAQLELEGVETQLDRMMLDGISDAITHLLRNAIAHGIEPPAERERAGKPAVGRIVLRAEQRGSMVAISVSDDGRGVARELLSEAGDARPLSDVLARAGVSTAGEVSEVAGRGVGLDAVKAHVESVRGGVEVHSEPGAGTKVTMTIPLTLALLRVLLLDRGGSAFGLPLTSVEEAVTVADTVSLGGRAAIELRGRSIPLSDLAQIVGGTAPPLLDQPKAVIVSSSGRRVAAACDRIIEEQEVVIKSLGPMLERVPGYLGAAILGDGGVALILDPTFVTAKNRRPGTLVAPSAEQAASKVLVVDDQFTVRELERSILEAAGYRVDTARDGSEAFAKVVSEPDVGLVVTDVEMPEMDGIELLRCIRAEPGHASLPIVVVSARGSDEDRRRGVEMGADAYIVKDEFNQQALLDTVERLLAR
jgi:two-component system, chemotaxis family, sensor kinase CheA